MEATPPAPLSFIFFFFSFVFFSSFFSWPLLCKVVLEEGGVLVYLSIVDIADPFTLFSQLRLSIHSFFSFSGFPWVYWEGMTHEGMRVPL